MLSDYESLSCFGMDRISWDYRLSLSFIVIVITIAYRLSFIV